MRADGRTPFQRAVARAYNSPVGLGGGAYHGGHAGGRGGVAPTSGSCAARCSTKSGCSTRRIRRGEDWELNLRIRRAGYRVWFDPSLAVTYWPRESWTRLVRQFSATGRWRGELVRRYGRGNSLRFFAPPALVLIARAQHRGRRAAGHRRAVGVVVGRGIRRLSAGDRVRRCSSIVVALGRGGGTGWRDKLWTLAVLPTMHLVVGHGVSHRRAARRARHRRHVTARRRNTPLP